MKLIHFLLAAALVIPAAAQAQTAPVLATVVTTCGTPPVTYTAGQQKPILQNTSGQQCSANAISGGTITTITNPVGVKGADGSAITSVSNPFPVAASPGARTIVTLAIKTVTTGGTAVNAISAGGRTAGGFIQNPPSATINLCINEIGTATGTTSSGDTTCILPGQSYTVAPASTAVSVISSDSAHPFSGYGLN